MRYAGKKSVVIGGTIGMGLATVRALVEGGAEVLVTGRNPQRLADVQRELGTQVQVLTSNAASLRDIEALATHIADTFDQIDFVFINAGIALLEPFEQVSEASYDEMFNTNTKGAYFTVKHLAPLVRDGGAFVFTTSIANDTGEAGMSVYAGTKAALRAFAKGFAAELLPRGIRVNAVSPGFIKTPTMGVAGLSAEEAAAFEKMGHEITPMKRVGTPEEVAKAVLFLAFDATFTTGVEFPVDGGLAQGISAPHS